MALRVLCGSFRRSQLVLAAFVCLQCAGRSPPETESPTPASLFEPNRVANTTPNESSESVTTAGEGEQRGAADASDKPKSPFSEAQIAMVLSAANDSQIELAKSAQARSGDARIKKFAGALIADHTQLRRKQAELNLATAESQLSSEMGMDSGRTRSLLHAMGPEGFDKTFIAAEVDIHRKLLSALDEKLMPNAHDPALRALVRDARVKTERALKQAEELQAQLGP